MCAQIASRIYTDWNLYEHVLLVCKPPFNLLRYYLIYWDYSHFITQIKFTEFGVSLDHQGITYSARLLQGEDWRDFQKSKRVCLSFRAWPDSRTGEFTGVVLVKRAC